MLFAKAVDSLTNHLRYRLPLLTLSFSNQVDFKIAANGINPVDEVSAVNNASKFTMILELLEEWLLNSCPELIGVPSATLLAEFQTLFGGAVNFSKDSMLRPRCQFEIFFNVLSFLRSRYI